MTGRPSDYTPDLADRLCAELADGRSLRSVCLADDMPSKATVFNWLRTIPEFLDQYTRAKEEAADSLADDIVDIADERDGKAIMADGAEVAVVFDSTAVARNRLRVDSRKWIAAKLKPKKYGDKVEVDNKHSGVVGITILTAVPEPAPDAPDGG